jgi:predicted enzyme related to lactoylglutathione lyase
MATDAAKGHVANWFEIPVKDLARARTFYETVFDVELAMEDTAGLKLAMFPFTRDAPGASGALVKGPGYEPSHAGSMVYFTVESIDETLRRINANGGKTLMPKTSIGQYGAIARYEDTEGNRLALHSIK